MRELEALVEVTVETRVEMRELEALVMKAVTQTKQENNNPSLYILSNKFCNKIKQAYCAT